MGKDSKKHLVGQPIFKQIIKMLPKEEFDLLVNKLGSDKNYRSFYSWDELVTMLFGIFSRCDSMGEVCDSMRAMGGKLNYLGMAFAPAKSTAGDGLRNRDEELFKQHYFRLIEYFKPIMSVSRVDGVSFEQFYAFDSTTITLWREEGVFFVTRQKKNAKSEVLETLYECPQTDKDSRKKASVLKGEHIHLRYKDGKNLKPLCLRRLTYRDEKGRIDHFITNNWEITGEEVALIYKYRWTIELVFKS